MNGQKLELGGKIAVELSNSYGMPPHIYFPFTNQRIVLKSSKGVNFGGLHWENTTENFVGTVYFENKIGRITRGNVVRFDLNCEVIDTVYEANDNEITGNSYLSNRDNKLLFTLTTDNYNEAEPLEQLNQPVSIVIMDFNKKQIIKKIESIGPSSKIEFNESPWFSDEERFIYGIRSDRTITIEGNRNEEEQNKITGIYVYDLRTNNHTLLLDKATEGVVSPVADQIAYIRENEIWTFDLKSNKSRLLYTSKLNEKLIKIHWTPDGKYVYFTLYSDRSLSSFTSDEKLIRAEDGEEINFKKIGIGYSNYTWK